MIHPYISPTHHRAPDLYIINKINLTLDNIREVATDVMTIVYENLNFLVYVIIQLLPLALVCTQIYILYYQEVTFV